MISFSRTLALLSFATAAVPLHAATTLFSENFDTDHSANWTFSSSIGATDTADDSTGGYGNAFFDYGALVPPAPGGTSTIGMKMVANLPTTNVFSGMTMTLNNQNFDFANKPYKITAQVWLNYYGGTTSGTTEMVHMGVGGTPDTVQFPGGTLNSVMFATSTDGDTPTTDWRVYTAPGAPLQPASKAYAADPDGTGTVVANGPLDSANTYYTSHFPGGELPPALQQSAFPDQQQSTIGMPASAGTVAFAWHRWTITTSPNGGPINYYISDAAGKDVLIGTVDGSSNTYTLAGNSIYFGMFDTGTSSPPTTVNADQLLFGLIDNVKVDILYGDANQNGKIDADDYALLDRGFALTQSGGTATGWANGDFDASGTIDQADYLLIDTAYAAQGGSLEGLLAQREAQFGAAYTSSLLAAIPEPTSLLAAGGLALFSLRRRQTR